MIQVILILFFDKIIIVSKPFDNCEIFKVV